MMRAGSVNRYSSCLLLGGLPSRRLRSPRWCSASSLRGCRVRGAARSCPGPCVICTAASAVREAPARTHPRFPRPPQVWPAPRPAQRRSACLGARMDASSPTASAWRSRELGAGLGLALGGRAGVEVARQARLAGPARQLGACTRKDARGGVPRLNTPAKQSGMECNGGDVPSGVHGLLVHAPTPSSTPAERLPLLAGCPLDRQLMARVPRRLGRLMHESELGNCKSDSLEWCMPSVLVCQRSSGTGATCSPLTPMGSCWGRACRGSSRVPGLPSATRTAALRTSVFVHLQMLLHLYL